LLTGCDNMLSGFIFFPERRLESRPEGWGLTYEEVWVTAADGVRLHGWHLPAPSGRTLLLFCHGNAGNISHRLDNIQRLLQAGMSVYIFDYRGYGLSEGSPSEKGLCLDAEAAFVRAQEMARAQGQRLVVFGRSLGGVAAVHLACRGGCAGVILESTFTNLGAMAQIHYHLPLKPLLAGRFDSLGKIGGLRCPALFIHGDQDDVVPYALGRELYEAAPNPKEFLTIPGAGHNDTYQVGGPAYFQRLREFCEGLPLS
jgi:fermentation-respiration switch protein FrsA (DUF1100 family)